MHRRHRYAHIMHAFTLDCRPGAVQKTPQFRALRKVSEIIDHFVGSRRSRAVGVRSQGGEGPPVSTSCRRSARNDYLSLPRFWCRMILRRYLRSLGDCGRCSKVKYNRVHLDILACESYLRHVHTARDRPHSTKWSRMVPVGASLSLVDFDWTGGLLLPDLEKTSGNDARAGIFQVRHAVSDAGERSVFRKSDLRRIDTHSQISAT